MPARLTHTNYRRSIRRSRSFSPRLEWLEPRYFLSAQPQMVADINQGGQSSFPAEFTDVAGTLFFTAYDGVTGLELWKSDGSESGTTLVKDIHPQTSQHGPRFLTASGDRLFFVA